MFKRIHKYLLVGFSIVCVSTHCDASRIINKNPTKENWKCKIIGGKWKCDRFKKTKNIFNKELQKSQLTKAMANDLGWINKPNYFVGGYYNNDSAFTKALCESKKTDLSYENAEYNIDGTLIVSGNIEILQCDQEIYSNNAIISFKNDKSSIQSLVMTGNVIAKQPSTGINIRTNELDTNVDDGTYSAGKTFFRIAMKVPKTRIYNTEHFSGYLRGYADTFKKQGDDLILENAYITSGDPYDNDWKLTGRTIDIDTRKEMVYIQDGFLQIKNIKLLYVPYFSYPISNKRESGFLTPNIVNTRNTGYGISIPYYFNLAPNYDLTLETILWSKRGLMENGIFKYMTNHFKGRFEGSIVPYDLKTKKMRGDFSYLNTGDFDNGITTNLRYDYVSDSEYYNNFSTGNINLVTKTLLDRQFDINYSNKNSTLSLTLLNYDVINPKLDLINKPYGKLPEIRLDATADGYTPNYLSLSIETLNTYFYKSISTIGTRTKTLENTNTDVFRSYESPKIQGNFSESWGFLNSSLEIPIRYYKFNNRTTRTTKLNKSNITSVLPIFNVEAGAYFDRDYATKDGTYTQTLKPRLFYTYIPYKDQTNIPRFDTSLQNEQYMQMFQVNRFTGYDRINNANQITYALELSTRNKDDSSILYSAKIGQMMHLTDRKVTLCENNSKCANSKMTDIFAKDTFSPIMSSFEYQIINNIYFLSQVNYRVQQKRFDYQIYQLGYKDKNENIFNISYNNIANNWNALTNKQINSGVKPITQKTIAISTVINLNNKWGIAGLWNYNFQQKQISHWFAGLQYNEKSWAIRALIQASAFTNKNPNNPQKLGPLTNSYIFQFELKGIGKIGNSSNLSPLLKQINGYELGQWGNVI